jgi:hypothetical protein
MPLTSSLRVLNLKLSIRVGSDKIAFHWQKNKIGSPLPGPGPEVPSPPRPMGLARTQAGTPLTGRLQAPAASALTIKPESGAGPLPP